MKEEKRFKIKKANCLFQFQQKKRNEKCTTHSGDEIAQL